MKKTFSSLGLPDFLTKNLERIGYPSPYLIQEKVIPVVMGNRDVLGIAPTGSGKTASFALPILAKLLNTDTLNSRNRYPHVLVMVPTRELADQVKAVFTQLSSGLPQKIKTIALYGGVSVNPQMIALQGCQVVVATPGRLLDLIECNALKLDDVNTLVIDEADKLLNLGFQDEMKAILNLIPLMRQNLLFSATLNKDVKAINELVLNQPEVINLSEIVEELPPITQKAYRVKSADKGPLLRQILNDAKDMQVLIFTSSIYKADHVADKLRKNNIPATAIHGKKSQGARTEALALFKAGKIRVLVATDLLGRGIDIKHLPMVINYELPRSPKDYVHRIGRTGRAGEPGMAISFIDPEEEHHFGIIMKKTKQEIERLTYEK